MKPTTGRAYVIGATLLVFFVVLGVVATRPFGSAAASSAATTTQADPRAVALVRREKALQRRARHVQQTLDRRWDAYQRRLAERRRLIKRVLREHDQKVEAARLAATRAPRVGVYAPSPSPAPAPAPVTRSGSS